MKAMRAPKLVQLMKSNSVLMSDGLVEKIRASGKCRELLLRVPESEQRKYASEIYQALTEWLEGKPDSVLEPHYVALGVRRSGQGVPVSQLLWAVSIARESLWEYMQQECLHEEPVEFWGGVMLLRSLNSFFDHVLYFALTGYEKAGEDESAAVSFLASRRSA
jgi:hypothetical protein